MEYIPYFMTHMTYECSGRNMLCTNRARQAKEVGVVTVTLKLEVVRDHRRSKYVGWGNEQNDSELSFTMEVVGE